MKFNAYTSYYKKEIKKKNINFLEPAENFIRIFKMNITKKKQKCLDFGVGDGRHTEYLLNKKHSVLSTDISEEAINLSKKRLRQFKNFKLFNDKSYLTKKFSNNLDLIICWETIHWLGNLKEILQLLKNFYNMLKKTGKLIITFPAPDHYLLKNKIKKYTYKIKYHERRNMEICAPSLAYLLKKFKDYNFKIDGIYKYSHGRKLLLKGKDNLKNIDYTNNLFSMYGFCITKK